MHQYLVTTDPYLFSLPYPKFSKKIMFNQLHKHFKINKLYCDSQYGFRENHSTEFASLELIARILLAMDKGEIPFSIFIDLSKAFDTLDHERLLFKLRYYGLENIALKLFHSYLKACAQRFRYALFALIHTQTYFEYYTLTLRLASLVKKAVIYAYWTKELFDICRENVSHMATLPSVARHVIHADNLRQRH